MNRKQRKTRGVQRSPRDPDCPKPGKSGVPRSVLSLRPKLLAGAIASLVWLPVSPALANPGGPTVIHGHATFEQHGNTLEVTNTPGAILHWQSFSIAQDEITRFQQQSATSAVLNRVTGGGISELFGELLSNGQVFLINPNGVVFGQNFSLDTAGFVASTLDIADADFLAGRFNFNGDGGRIVNQGYLTSRSGNVFFIAPDIENAGIIHTESGTLVLAAGRSVRIGSLDHPDIAFEVQAPEDQVLNLGTLIAEHGSIQAFAGTLIHSGEIRADRLALESDGTIVLSATGDVHLHAGSSVAANGPSGGDIRIESTGGGTLWLEGAITATGDSGTGGSISLLGDRVGLFGDASVVADGHGGGGTVLVGGNVRGEGPEPNATAAYVGPNASVSASATAAGDGGTVIVYADEVTRVHGQLSARGGPAGGDGGFIETSAAWIDVTRTPNAGSTSGAPGLWLIDPVELHIVAGDVLAEVVQDADNGTIFFDVIADAELPELGAERIEEAINLSSTSVIIDTQGNAGIIRVLAPLTFDPSIPDLFLRFNVIDGEDRGDIFITQPILNVSASSAMDFLFDFPGVLEIGADLRTGPGGQIITDLNPTGTVRFDGEFVTLDGRLVANEVLIDSAGVTFNQPFAIQVLNVTNGFAEVQGMIGALVSILNLSGGTITGSGDIDVASELNWTAGTMDGVGTTRILEDATATLDSVAPKVLEDRTIFNLGSMNWLGGNLELSGIARLQNEGAFDIDLAAPAAMLNGGGSPLFESLGLLQHSGGITEISVDTSFDGSVNVVSGTFELAGQNFYRALTTLGDDTRLVFAASGSHTLNQTTISGPGVLEIAGPTLIVSGQGPEVENVDLIGPAGAINGGGAILIDGTFKWLGGSMGRFGTGDGIAVVTLPGSNMLIDGPDTKTVQAFVSLLIDGSATWRDGDIAMLERGFINTSDTFVVDLVVPRTVGTADEPLSFFGNQGTFIHAAGSASMTINTPFFNGATMTLDAGLVTARVFESDEILRGTGALSVSEYLYLGGQVGTAANPFAVTLEGSGLAEIFADLRLDNTVLTLNGTTEWFSGDMLLNAGSQVVVNGPMLVTTAESTLGPGASPNGNERFILGLGAVLDREDLEGSGDGPFDIDVQAELDGVARVASGSLNFLRFVNQTGNIVVDDGFLRYLGDGLAVNSIFEVNAPGVLDFGDGFTLNNPTFLGDGTVTGDFTLTGDGLTQITDPMTFTNTTVNVDGMLEILASVLLQGTVTFNGHVVNQDLVTVLGTSEFGDARGIFPSFDNFGSLFLTNDAEGFSAFVETTSSALLNQSSIQMLAGAGGGVRAIEGGFTQTGGSLFVETAAVLDTAGRADIILQGGAWSIDDTGLLQLLLDETHSFEFDAGLIVVGDEALFELIDVGSDAVPEMRWRDGSFLGTGAVFLAPAVVSVGPGSASTNVDEITFSTLLIETGGTLVLGGTAIADQVSLNGGAITGDNTLFVNGSLNWLAGDIGDGDLERYTSVIVGSLGTAIIDSPAPKAIRDAQLIVLDELIWRDGDIALTGSGVLVASDFVVDLAEARSLGTPGELDGFAGAFTTFSHVAGSAPLDVFSRFSLEGESLFDAGAVNTDFLELSGHVRGSGSLFVRDTFEWRSGTIGSAGDVFALTLESGAVGLIDSFAEPLLIINARLTLNGPTEWTTFGFNEILLDTGGRLEVNDLFTTSTAGAIVMGSGATGDERFIVGNGGIVEMDGSGVVDIDVQAQLDGLIRVFGGSLNFLRFVDQTGDALVNDGFLRYLGDGLAINSTFEVNAPGVLDFGDGFTLNNPTFLGDGTITGDFTIASGLTQITTPMTFADTTVEVFGSLDILAEVLLLGTVDFDGDVINHDVLRVRGSSEFGDALAIFPNLDNRGSLILSSEASGFAATVQTLNGPLSNSGMLELDAANGGDRALLGGLTLTDDGILSLVGGPGGERVLLTLSDPLTLNGGEIRFTGATAAQPHVIDLGAQALLVDGPGQRISGVGGALALITSAQLELSGVDIDLLSAALDLVSADFSSMSSQWDLLDSELLISAGSVSLQAATFGLTNATVELTGIASLGAGSSFDVDVNSSLFADVVSMQGAGQRSILGNGTVDFVSLDLGGGAALTVAPDIFTGTLAIDSSSADFSGDLQTDEANLSSGAELVTRGSADFGSLLIDDASYENLGASAVDDLQLLRGEISNTGTLSIRNQMGWVGGALTGSGTTTVLPSTTLTIVPGTQAHSLSGQFLDVLGNASLNGVTLSLSADAHFRHSGALALNGPAAIVGGTDSDTRFEMAQSGSLTSNAPNDPLAFVTIAANRIDLSGALALQTAGLLLQAPTGSVGATAAIAGATDTLLRIEGNWSFDPDSALSAAELQLGPLGTNALIEFGGVSLITSLVLESGARLELGPQSVTQIGTFDASGELLLENAQLLASDLQINGALLGNGTVVGNVTNAGRLAAGTSPGQLTIDGNYAQTASGLLQIEIDGAAETPGVDFDFLEITGSASFDGTLEFIALDGFTGTLGSSFTPITYASVSTTFNNVIQPPNLLFDPVFGPNGMVTTLNMIGGDMPDPGGPIIDPSNPPIPSTPEEGRQIARIVLEAQGTTIEEVEAAEEIAELSEEQSRNEELCDEQLDTPAARTTASQGVGCRSI